MILYFKLFIRFIIILTCFFCGLWLAIDGYQEYKQMAVFVGSFLIVVGVSIIIERE